MHNYAVLMKWFVAETVLLATCGSAFGQTPLPSQSAPAPADSAVAATPAPLPQPQPAEPVAAAPPVAPPTTPPSQGAPIAGEGATAAAEPASTPIPSYFRIDHDYAFGLQLWAGATYPVGENIGIATDIYLAENYPGLLLDSAGAVAGTKQSWWGEFDIGPAFTFGPLSVTPMVGLAFDWAAKRAVAINGPQLYTIVNLDKIYFESWIWTLLYSPFKDQVLNDYFHTRDWILYKLSGTVALGPQIELWTNLQNKLGPKGITSLPIGGHVDLAYGTGNTLGIFLGYETHKDARELAGGKGAVGRLTFVHNF